MATRRFTYLGKLYKYMLLKIKYLEAAKPRVIEKMNILIKYIEFRKKLILAGLSIIVILIGVVFGYSYYQTNLITLYNVYLDDEKIGTVDNKDIVYIWKSYYLMKAQEDFGPINLDSKNTITFTEEVRYKGEFDNYHVIGVLEDNIDIEAKGVSVYINGQLIGIVKDKFTYENILNNIKDSYVPRDDKRKITASTISSTKEQPLELVNVSIVERIKTVETKTAPENILDEKTMTELLLQESIEQKLYKVRDGETANDIAEFFEMTLDELYQLNPEIEKKDDIVGVEIKVIERRPLLTIKSEERLTQYERVPYSVMYENVDSMYVNESIVITEGKEGKIEVEYALFKENGILQEVKIVDKRTIEEPREMVVLKGTMEIPAKGSGILSWPTNGGIISSFYGQRWGSFHYGIDISRTDDYDILAADNGVIIYAGWRDGYGKTVIIDHGNGYETLYAHLSIIDVTIGETIAKGQKIGIMGNTGRTTGTHLHFEVIINGESRNPLNYVGI